jgi:hypothetical protein
LTGDDVEGLLGDGWGCVLEISAFAAAAAAAAAAASSRFRLNNPGESSVAAAAGCVASEEKNFEGAAGAETEETEADFDSAEEADAKGAAAPALGFVKKLRMSMVRNKGRNQGWV